jgi:hypothetical protein
MKRLFYGPGVSVLGVSFLVLCLGSVSLPFSTAEMPSNVPTIASRTPDTETTTSLYIENCKRAGFDPWHLACDTCTILPTSVQETCQYCCQSYKTLDSQATRYAGAILIDTGSSSALEEFYREDKDIVWNQKKGIKRKKADMGGSGGMFQLYAQPSLILWYDKDPPSESSSLEKLSEDAVEIMTLDGLGRDDIREMLLALLPDQ